MKPTRHRNLFNGDCGFLFAGGIYQPEPGPYTAEVFHRYVHLLADSGVDTFLVNPGGQMPWYPSKVLPNILSGYQRGDRDFFRGHCPPLGKDWTTEMLEKQLDENVKFLNRYLDLVEAGVDWIAEISKACRKCGVSPWVSLRMNDGHGGHCWEKSYMNCALQKDPKYRLSGREINPREGVNKFRQLLNYEHKEVRDHYFAMARELVEEYDFEGLELDWLRLPYCCEPPASQETVDAMTVWFAEIRALTRARSKKTGKPYPLGLRIPVRLGLLRTIGMDVRELARQDLIDFVAPSNSWQTTWDVPYDQLRSELGDEVAIYGVIEDAPNWMHAHDPKSKKSSYRLLSTSAELLRGNAAGKLALGADGIETFNFFCSDEAHVNPAAGKQVVRANYPALRGLEDLENLRGKPKHYALSTHIGGWMLLEWEYAEQVPAILEPEWRHAFRLSMCAEPADSKRSLTIQLVVEKKETLPELGVSFNGLWPNFEVRPTDELLFPTGIFTHHVSGHQALNYRFNASAIKEGWNEIVVYHSPSDDGIHYRATSKERLDNSVCIVSVELSVG